MLGLIADLGVADKVPSDGHITVDDLAAACAVQPEPMLRVLRVLAALKIFQVTTHGTVAHTSRSRLLRTDTPNTLHHAARFWAGPGVWNAWGRIDVAMTGGIPHEAAWNTSRFSYLLQHPDEARAFDAMMESNPLNRRLLLPPPTISRPRGSLPTLGAAMEPHCDTSCLAFLHRADSYSTVRMSSTPSPRNNCCRGGSLFKRAASSIKSRVEPTSTC